MFNGAPNRYTWTLKGKQELLIPYNDYRLHSDKLKYADIIRPGHINPEHVRYEKHRVWVVEANLKDNTRHIYKNVYSLSTKIAGKLLLPTYMMSVMNYIALV